MRMNQMLNEGEDSGKAGEFPVYRWTGSLFYALNFRE